MMRLWIIVFAALATTVLPGLISVDAQQKQAGSDSTFAIEIVDSAQPGIQSPVLGPPSEGGFMETSHFKWLSTWQQPAGIAPLTRLRIRSMMEGEAVRIKVAAVFDDSEPVDAPGPKYGQTEKQIASYLAREGETVRIRELKEFGVVPVVLKVVRVKPRIDDPTPAITPKLVNNSKAVEIINFDREGPSSTFYSLSLRNVSSKNIIALNYYVDEEGGRNSQTTQGSPGRPIMKPGATYQDHVSINGGGGRMTPQGFVPDPPQQKKLVIGTVIFDDGTYEGEVETAASIEARRRGRKIQLTRVLSALQDVLSAPEKETAETLEKLRAQVSSLRIDVDQSLVDELIIQYPSLPREYSRNRLMQDVMSGLRNGREEALRRIQELEKLREQSSENGRLHEQLNRMKEEYESMVPNL